MIIFINNKSTKFCKVTLHIKRFIYKRKLVLFLLHSVLSLNKNTITSYLLHVNIRIAQIMNKPVDCGNHGQLHGSAEAENGR